MRIQTLYFVILLLAAGRGFAGADVTSITNLLRAREFTRALTQIEAQLEQSPKNPQLLTLRGIAHTGLGDDTAALMDYRRALRIAPDYIPALKAEAQIEYERGDKDGIATLHRVLRQEPSDPVSHAMLAALAFQQHDCRTTVENYAASEQLLSSQPVALAQYGQCLAQENQQARAIETLQRAAVLAPENWQARYNLSLEEFRASQPENARNDLQPLLTPDQHQPDILNLAATLDEAAGDTPHAVEYLRRAIVDNPKTVELYLHFADLCFVHRSFQVGIDMLNAGLTQLPNSAQLYVARGVMFVQLGKYDSAEADFTRAEELNPNQSFSAVAQGLTKLQQNNLDAALTSTRAEVKRDPSNAFLHYLLAETLRQRGATPPSEEFKEAVEQARTAIRLKPDYPIAEDLLGSFYLKEEKLQLAEQQFESALKHDPSNESALYHMITVARKTDHTNDIPGLMKRLAGAKAADKKRDDLAGQFILVEPK